MFPNYRGLNYGRVVRETYQWLVVSWDFLFGGGRGVVVVEVVVGGGGDAVFPCFWHDSIHLYITLLGIACPNDFEEDVFKKYCHKYIGQPLTAQEAIDYCKSLGAHLVEINTEAENAHMSNVMGNVDRRYLFDVYIIRPWATGGNPTTRSPNPQ